MKKITIDQIAEMAHVSRSVVSRVLNNRQYVSAEARARVLKVIEELNYVPSAVARSLVMQRRQEIGLLFPGRTSESRGFFVQLYLGISEACVERGYMVSATIIAAEEAKEKIVGQRKFGGYILVADEIISGIGPALSERNIPAVIVGPNPNLLAFSSFDAENEHGGYLATQHLINLGHRRIGVITSPKEPGVRKQRIDGYYKALEEAGLPIFHELIASGIEAYEGGYKSMMHLLQQDVRPTAVFCDSDVLAFGALHALHEAGVSVPEEMAVVGFDDLPLGKYSVPALTTVQQPTYQMGQEAAHHLIDQIEGKQEASVRKILPVELIVRDSCGGKKGEA